MEDLYRQITAYIVERGRELKTAAGNISVVAKGKEIVTELDLSIERGLVALIQKYAPTHSFLAEEEHSEHTAASDIWIIDPISGTSIFADGAPHYGISVAHEHRGTVNFSAVYDPSVDELWTAYRGKGIFLNGQPINTLRNDQSARRVLLNFTTVNYLLDGWREEIIRAFSKFNLFRTRYCFAVAYAQVAAGRFGAVVSFGKDVFTEYAGSLLITEAGGLFTTGRGEKRITVRDRIFVGGFDPLYQEVFAVVENLRRSGIDL